MTALAILQARMGSTRLPGKVLAPIAGRPLLQLMLERLTAGAIDVVVATSDRGIDDPIESLATGSGVPCVRGPEDDVLQRFVIALENEDADHVVRLTADCPLVDAALVQEAVTLAARSGAAYVSNSLVRTFPDGLDVEVVRRDALEQAADEAIDPVEREHVTPFIYRRPERFDLHAFTTTQNLGHLRWTVDTPDDLAKVQHIADALDDPVRASWTEVLASFGESEPRTGLRLEPIVGIGGVGPPSYPAARSWLVIDDSQPLGWLRVSVTDGLGAVDGAVPPDVEDAARRLLDGALAQDFQIRALEFGPMGDTP